MPPKCSSNRIRITLIAVCFFTYFGVANVQQAQVQTLASIAQTADAKNPSPELVGKLTNELSITPEQAIGRSRALFGLAKSRLKPEEFTKMADAVPGMDGLLKAAPKPKQGSTGALGGVGTALPGKAVEFASVNGSFKSLGLSPDMTGKFVFIMTQYVDVKGGASASRLLAGALKFGSRLTGNDKKIEVRCSNLTLAGEVRKIG